MSLKQELDGLRTAHAGVDDLVYADLSAHMVLYASSGHSRSQELFDRLLNRAGKLLSEQGPLAGVTGVVGLKASNSVVVEGDGSGLRIFVRVQENEEECLIFSCRPGADSSAIATLAAETLTRFASSEG